MKCPENRGLPEKIKVTISREDGSPVFSWMKGPEVYYLVDTAPALVVLWDGETLTMKQGNLNNLQNFIGDLTRSD